MKCDSEILTAYVLGDLDDAQRERVDAHVGQCRPCAGRLAELRQTIQLLAALPEAESRPVDMEILQSAIASGRPNAGRPPAGEGRFWGSWRWAVALSAAACLAFLCFHYGVAVRVGDFQIAFGGPGQTAPTPQPEANAPPAGLVWDDAALRDLIREEIRTQVTPTFLQLAGAVEKVEDDLLTLHDVQTAQRAYDMRQMTRNLQFVANAVEETLGPR